MSRIVSWLSELSYRRAGYVIAIVLLLSSFGAITLTRVDQELLPDIQFPLATVIIQSPGQQPEQLVQSTVGPIEAATRNVEGVKSIESTSVSGLSVILYSFDFGTGLDQMEQRLGEALDASPVGRTVNTTILTFDPASLPVLTFDLQGDLSQAELLQIAQGQVIPALSNLDGVAAVDVVGGAIDEVLITLDRGALLERGISYDQVSQILQANNVILPSGQLQTGDTVLPLQTVALLTSIDQISAISIPTADGSSVRLDEIGTVELQSGTPVGYSRTDGQPSVSVRVTKDTSANTVTVANAVAKELDVLNGQLPAGVSISVFENQADFITASIRSLVEEGVIGGILAIVVVFLFLRNWRTTLITAVSIPLSLVTAVIVLDQFGYSLNIMTLAGLTIAIGRVIDDSIVVLENVYRHMAEGEPPFAAVINGAREVTIAILGATATTCAVFLPLGLVGGLIGELFLPFAIAVVAALVASLLVAVTVVPMMSRFALANKVKIEPEKRPGDTLLGRIYTPVLQWALRNRWKTLAITTVLFFGSMALTPLLPVAFLPDSGENAITISVDARPGQTADSVLDEAIRVEGLLDQLGAIGYQTVITGASGDIGAIGNIITGNSPNSATIIADLPSAMDRQQAATDLRQMLAEQMPESDTISVSASSGDFGSGVSITLSAETPQGVAALPDFTAQVAEKVASVADTANVSSNLSAVLPSVDIRVDQERAAAAGLSPAQISGALASLSSVSTVTTANLDTGSHPVRMIVSGADANDVDELAALEVARGVALGDVADLEVVDKQVSITRVNGRPASTVSADITSQNTGGVSTEVQQAVNTLSAPDGVEVLVGGVAGDIDEGFTSMFAAIFISIALVYLIMALLFGSWLDPLVILFTLPLAAIGAIIALLVTGSAISLSALIGILMLVGIVVTNAIVLLEFVIMLRKERGYSLQDALVEGAQTRLRPILMTAFAAMLALIPLSLGLTEGLLIASDLGRVVIGGLFSSTLLTLLVIPVVYSLFDGLRERLRRRRDAKAAAADRRTPSAELRGTGTPS